jgi:hypothetical protein
LRARRHRAVLKEKAMPDMFFTKEELVIFTGRKLKSLQIE